MRVLFCADADGSSPTCLHSISNMFMETQGNGSYKSCSVMMILQNQDYGRCSLCNGFATTLTPTPSIISSGIRQAFTYYYNNARSLSPNLPISLLLTMRPWSAVHNNILVLNP